ncbi:hypothetical protein QEG73_07920 [Chitinophagaceae bacterium 26-R-25]|nr:hypothetical protein [Chitinophagaceae bacterium 26-R-25]
MNAIEKELVVKCPSCGEMITGLSRVCPSCDAVINTAATNQLDAEISELDDAIIAIRTVYQPNTANTALKVLLCCGTGGLYIIYKKLLKWEHVFNTDKELFYTRVAVAEKEIRTSRMSYGANKEIAKLITDSEREKNNLVASRRKFVFIGRFVTVAFFAFFILAQKISLSSNEYLKVDKMLRAGKVKEAKEYVATVKNELTRANLEVEIKETEINGLIKEKKLAEAVAVFNTISDADTAKARIKKTITTVQVKVLIDAKKFEEAKAFVAALNVKEAYKLSLLQLITYGEIETYASNGKADLAYAMINGLDAADSTKSEWRDSVVWMEVKQLLANEKYDDALKKVKLASNENVREELIEKIVAGQVNSLITAKKFKKARQRADLIRSYDLRKSLNDKIDFEEKISN